MSQDIFDDIQPASTSGTELATLLNEFKDAIASGFSGDTARPANLQENGYWIKYNTPDNGLLSFYLYDGTQDIELFQINKATATIILSNSEDEFNIVKNSDDAIGPDLGMKKGRITGDQTLTSDVLGNIKWIGRDGSAVEYTQAQITTTALEDVTSGAHGANIAFYVTQEGTSSLVKAITISDEKKLGIGVDDPTMMVETFDTSANAGYKATIAQDSTSGPSMTLHKKRVTTNGQVLTGDTIGNFKLQSTDNAGAEIPAGNIKAVAAEDHLATQGGTNIVIERVKLGEVALSTAVTINDGGMTIADDLTVTGTINADGGMVPTGDVTFPQDVTITGDLTVNGTTTTIDTETLDVEDANITINKNGTDATSEGAGLTVERTGTDGSIIYEDAATSKFKVGAAGSEVEVADISSTQTLTNKTVSGGTVTGASQESPARSDVKKDTEANLITYAATAADGQMCFATDTQKMYQIIDNDLEDVGGGGVGNTETIAILDGEDDIADWDTTGLTNATLVINSTTPLNGDNDYKFGNVTGSTGEIAWSPNKLVPLKSQSSTNLLGVDLAGSYGGDDNDLKLHFYDVTNSEYLESVFVKAGDGLRYELLGYADSTASIKWGIEVIQVNDGKFFFFDDVQFKKVVYPMVEVNNTTNWAAYTPTIQGFGTVSGVDFFWRRDGSDIVIKGRLTVGTTDANEAQITLPNGETISSIYTNASYVGHGWRDGVTQDEVTLLATSGDTYLNMSTADASQQPTIPKAGNQIVGSGAVLEFEPVSIAIEGWQAHANSTLVVNDTQDYDPYLHETVEKLLSADFGSTGDVTDLTFTDLVIGKEYEISGQLAIAAQTNLVHQYRFRSAASAGGNVYDGATNLGAELGSHINVKFTAVSTSLYFNITANQGTMYGNGTNTETYLQLRRVDLQPKLLALPNSKQNGFDVSVTGTTGAVDSDAVTLVSHTTGAYTYDLNTDYFTGFPSFKGLATTTSDGFLSALKGTFPRFIIYTRDVTTGSLGDRDFDFQITKKGADYTPPGVYVGKVDPIRTAYIKEQYSSGTYGHNGATFTSGVWTTRVLNTVTGDAGVVSLSSNQFTLAEGSYKIKVSSPAYNVLGHKIKLVKDPSGSPTDLILGGNEYNSGGSGSTQTRATLEGSFTITSSTAFEIQHRCSSTQASNGFGIPASYGVDEVYTQIEIEKL